ncbi:MAG: hypothetical protein J6W75_13560 [Bacteroidaceae bacterium]|nr:hypothetical protein [Bacteroidaceae bacterium]
MKKKYINPHTEVFNMIVESLLVESGLERGTDPNGGGNNAEVKSQNRFTGHTNPVNWDE